MVTIGKPLQPVKSLAEPAVTQVFVSAPDDISVGVGTSAGTGTTSSSETQADSPARSTSVSLDAVEEGPDLGSQNDTDDTLIAVVETTLEPPVETIFLLCIVEVFSIACAGHLMGVSESTARRYWKAIMVRLRETERAARD